NWLTSQTLRDKQAGTQPAEITAEQVVATAIDCGSGAVVSSYNEPLITAEWAYDIFSLAQQAGLKTALVSNGHGTPQALEFLRPVTDAIKIDLKSMSRASYRELGLSLKVVLDTLERAWRLGFWVEVVTLVVPGFNDTADELTEIAAFVAGVSPQIPWHVSAFHPDYRYTGAPPTPVDTLVQAGEIGRAAGLEYVYAGNVDALLPDMVNTTCPGCSAELIRRVGYYILDNQISEGRCPSCSREIPGVWA
ncbi:MAG: hypothetical protein KAU50_10895, partial [Candidatus Marinimicrobia bacterium]|nr:hypothetical protein [Candidatus Neomarinimicrobiota bacterium]